MNEDEILEAWKRERAAMEATDELRARLRAIEIRAEADSPTQVTDTSASSRGYRGIVLTVTAVLAASVLGMIRLSFSLFLGIH